MCEIHNRTLTMTTLTRLPFHLSHVHTQPFQHESPFDSFMYKYKSMFQLFTSFSLDDVHDIQCLVLHKQVMPALLSQCTSRSPMSFAEKLYLVNILCEFYDLFSQQQEVQSLQDKFRSLARSIAFQCCLTALQTPAWNTSTPLLN